MSVDERIESPTVAAAAAAAVGAADLFVLRRISETTFVHFGGAGRGEGWAGLVELDLKEEKCVRTALGNGAPLWVRSTSVRNMFGPYYAQSAVFVPVSQDVVAVFGSPDGDIASSSDADLLQAATIASDAIQAVTPAKRLADDLELLSGVRDVVTSVEGSVETVMEHIALAAATALSCEVGVLYLESGDRVVLGSRGWTIAATREEIASAMHQLLESRDRFPRCVQDAAESPLPEPLDAGVCSYYLVELTGTARGLLLLLHTDAAPRGFTLLCRRLGLKIAEVASATLGVALTREWIQGEADRLHAAFGNLSSVTRL